MKLKSTLERGGLGERQTGKGVLCFVFRVSDFGSHVSGLGCRVSGLGIHPAHPQRRRLPPHPSAPAPEQHASPAPAPPPPPLRRTRGQQACRRHHFTFCFTVNICRPNRPDPRTIVLWECRSDVGRPDGPVSTVLGKYFKLKIRPHTGHERNFSKNPSPLTDKTLRWAIPYGHLGVPTDKETEMWSESREGGAL